MDSTDIKSLLAVLTFLAGSGTTVIGMLRWLRVRIRDQDRREFEFNQIKDNQSRMLATLSRLENESRWNSSQMQIQTQLSQALVRKGGDSVSEILGHKSKKENDEQS